FDLGMLFEQAESWDQAEKAFREVVAVLDNPGPILELGLATREEVIAQNADTYERLGRICLKAGRPDRAVEAFVKAQKTDPLRAARLAYNLALVLKGQRKYREALAQVEKYLQTQPEGTEGYELKVQLQRKLGREADVLRDLAASAGRDPNNPALKLLLAR